MSRRTASLLTLFSFLAIALSSIVLYVLPGGRVSGVPVLFLGMTKGIWKELHITGGFLFLLAALWHTAMNLRAIKNYLSGSLHFDRKAVIPTIFALALTTFVYVGTLTKAEPMQTVLTIMKTAPASRNAAN